MNARLNIGHRRGTVPLLRCVVILRYFQRTAFLTGVLMLGSIAREVQGQSSNLLTVESYLLCSNLVYRVVVQQQSIYPPSPLTTFSFVRGKEGYVYSSPNLSAGNYQGLPWYFVNGCLYYHYPTDELPPNCRIALNQMQFIDNFGFSGLDRSKPVTRGDCPGMLIGEIRTTRLGIPKAVLQFEYKGELAVGGTLRLITNTSPLMRVDYEYANNFYGGTFPIAFTFNYLNPKATSKWTIVELDLTNRIFKADELNPGILFTPKAVLVESNGVTYVLENNKLERMPTYEEVQASLPFHVRVCNRVYDGFRKVRTFLGF
ncbi:MAG TPA: hypothetical protein VEC99_03180 [Clostridia bacterium]|nr:hypothetical protein [Clostridia bacterium]